MTYEQALEWLADNVPIEMFDSYNEWYDACRKEIQTPSLWDNPRFNRMHEDYWNGNKRQEETEFVEPAEIETQFTEHDNIVGTVGEQMENEETQFIAERQYALEHPAPQRKPRYITGMDVSNQVSANTYPQDTGAPIVIRESPTGARFMSRPPTLKESNIRLPPTGSAPIITTGQYDMTPPRTSFRQRISSGFKSFTARFRSGNNDNEYPE